MISKKTVYLYVLLMVVMIFGIIAVKLGYHVWVNKSTIETFDFNKAYFIATIISIVLFISNIRQHKDPTTISTSKDI